MLGTLFGNALDYLVMQFCVEMIHMHGIVLGCT
jgi:hypothetical protein